jgi:hypothetical protein
MRRSDSDKRRSLILFDFMDLRVDVTAGPSTSAPLLRFCAPLFIGLRQEGRELGEYFPPFPVSCFDVLALLDLSGESIN